MSEKLNNLLTRIQNNRVQFNNTVAQLKANKSLSELDREYQLTDAYRKAWKTHNKLHADFNAALESERSLAAQAALRPRANVSGKRDYAAFRAAVEQARNAPDTGKVLEQAIRTNDRELLRACAVVAHEEKHWGAMSVIAEYDKDVQAMVAIEQEHGDMLSFTQRIVHRGNFTKPFRPEGVKQSVDNELIATAMPVKSQRGPHDPRDMNAMLRSARGDQLITSGESDER